MTKLPKQLSDQEIKDIAKQAIKEFLGEQMVDIQNGVGKFVIRYGIALLVALLFHFTLGDKVYGKLAQIITTVGQ